MKRIKTGTMMYQYIIDLCDRNISKSGATSRNNFIEESILFYVGYLNNDKNINYTNRTISDTLNNRINLLEKQISSVLFKLVIELNILSTILATTTDIDTDTLKKLRIKSINEVKQTNGNIDLEEMFKSYVMREGD